MSAIGALMNLFPKADREDVDRLSGMTATLTEIERLLKRWERWRPSRPILTGNFWVLYLSPDFCWWKNAPLKRPAWHPPLIHVPKRELRMVHCLWFKVSYEVGKRR